MMPIFRGALMVISPLTLLLEKMDLIEQTSFAYNCVAPDEMANTNGSIFKSFILLLQLLSILWYSFIATATMNLCGGFIFKN